jgi:hypothetical protein
MKSGWSPGKPRSFQRHPGPVIRNMGVEPPRSPLTDALGLGSVAPIFRLLGTVRLLHASLARRFRQASVAKKR